MSVRYTVLIDGEPGAFGVVVPDAPGCTAMGNTLDEALGNGRAALCDWIAAMKEAGRAVPSVRDMATVVDDPEAKAVLATGSTLGTLDYDSGATD